MHFWCWNDSVLFHFLSYLRIYWNVFVECTLLLLQRLKVCFDFIYSMEFSFLKYGIEKLLFPKDIIFGIYRLMIAQSHLSPFWFYLHIFFLLLSWMEFNVMGFTFSSRFYSLQLMNLVLMKSRWTEFSLLVCLWDI